MTSKPLKKTHSLRWHLLVLVLGALIPFFAFSAVIAGWLVGSERKTSEQALARAAQDLATAADQEIESSIRTLKALTISLNLRQRKFEAVHDKFAQVLATQPEWFTILVHDSEGRVVVDARRPFGETPAPVAEPESLARVLREGVPVVGTLARGREPDGLLAFPIRVPVIEKGRVAYVLSAVVPAASMQKIVAGSVARSAGAGEWTRTLVDAGGNVVARSRLPEQFVGHKNTTSFADLVSKSESGIAQKTNLEGEPVYLAFRRTPSARWTAAIVVPVKTLDASANRARFLVTLIGFLLVAVFGGLALWWARVLMRSIQAAAVDAENLGQGGEPAMEVSRVREVEQLHQALIRAGDLLRTKTSEREELLNQANSARADAEKASRTKSEFLANMSHELRTPLGVILGVMDLYSSPDVTPAEQASLLARLNQNAEYLAVLIDQILDLSKVEANALEIENRPFSPRELLEDVVANLRVKADRKNIYLALTAEHLTSQFASDPLRLRQILMNVIGNAVKFTDRGGVTVTARSIAHGLGEDVVGEDVLEILVRDTGIGMTAEQGTRLFHPFTQADNSMTRRFGGTGLGLVVSRRFAQALGGDVELVEFEMERGSVFKITVRGTASDAPLVLPAPEPKTVFREPHARRLDGLRVLVVDDSVDNRFLIQRMLKIAGATTAEAQDGSSGITAAMEAEFDCVLMDIQMPQMDGNTATAELRRLGYRKPIIALTAHAMKTDREQAMKSGYTDYLTKPIDKARLLSVLEEYRADL